MTLGDLMGGEPARDWNPIAAAPKDGSEILICCEGAARHIARWDGIGWLDGRDLYLQPLYWMPLPDAPPEV